MVPPTWIDRGDGVIDAGDWVVLRIDRAALDRRGDRIVAQRLDTLGRRADVVIATDIVGNDLKSGWPMHGLQRLRDLKLCRYFAIETHDPLEAEWIATHTPVHAVVVQYTPREMAVRYRVFDAAEAAGVAILCRAGDTETFALHRATPAVCATITEARSGLQSVQPMPAETLEKIWAGYQAAHPEPPKLRGVHPPEASS